MLTAELCAGYGGIHLAMRALGWPVELAWYAEKDPDASTVMAHHHPQVANLGDITTVDWTRVQPVDVLTAGYPCQSFSNAGKRKGFADERAVWPHVADAIRDLRPPLVLLENVAGHLARGFGRVLGDLAALGYDAQWVCVRASDLGAPHQRNRVFVAAHPPDADRDTLWPKPFPVGTRHGAAVAGDDREGTGGLSLLPTPRASDGEKGGPNQRGSKGDLALPSAVLLLPTPLARDADRGMGGADREGRPLSETVMRLLPTPTASDGTQPPGAAASREGGPNLRTAIDELGLFTIVTLPPGATKGVLLPTPTVADSRGTRNATAGRTSTGHNDGWTLSDVAYADRWGQYSPAITRWERIIGRPAPDPTEPGRTGKPRLSARFVEWMMGLPEGHVTDLLPRNAALRVLGNGVVPIQAATGYRALSAVA